jgi:hypothetical protein
MLSAQEWVALGAQQQMVAWKAFSKTERKAMLRLLREMREAAEAEIIATVEALEGAAA